MADPFSNYLGIHGTALAMRELRMQTIASNLANADTPGFKAQDVDFNTALQQASQPGANDYRQAALSATFERPSSQPSIDGNTVDANREKAIFGQSAVEYRASLTFAESKFRSMLTAITGQ